MTKKDKPIWKYDFSSLDASYIGACFNPDGMAWAWKVKPEIKGSEKRPNDLKWRGPSYGEGYKLIGSVVSPVFAKEHWKESWIERF
jgi:hypothetical protein